MPVLCIDNRPMIAPLVETTDTIRSECHQALPVIVYPADLYNGTLTGEVCCSLNANTGASANHAGPSLVIKRRTDE